MAGASAADADAMSTRPGLDAVPRSSRFWVGTVFAAVAVSALVVFASGLGIDYLSPSCVTQLCDDPGASIQALARLDFSTFFAQQPPMGSFSLLLRAPFAGVADLLGGNDLLAYRLGAFACVLTAGLLAVHLAQAMARRGSPWMLCVLVPGAVVINPLTYQALRYGHPEEILGAALCVAAVLAAGRRRLLGAGLVLGAALATKQWALLAVVPVLVAAPTGGRVRVALVAVGMAAVLTLPMLVGNPQRFDAAQQRVSVSDQFEHTVTATNLWWPISSASAGEGTSVSGRQARLVQYSLPASVGRLTHPIVAIIAIGVTLLYFRRRRSDGPEEALQLLALVFLLRCVLDPLTFSYHHEPFLVALLAYEGLRRRVPLLSAFAIVSILVMDRLVAPTGEPGFINAFYLTWTLLLTGALASCVFAPEQAQRIAGRLIAPAGRSTPSPAGAP